MSRLALIALTGLAPRAVQRVAVAGRAPFAVFTRDGQYFVADDRCSHGEAALSEGELADYEILCPHHRGGFDIRTGLPTRPPCAQAITCYAVSLADGMLCIDID